MLDTTTVATERNMKVRSMLLGVENIFIQIQRQIGKNMARINRPFVEFSWVQKSLLKKIIFTGSTLLREEVRGIQLVQITRHILQ